MREVRQTVSTRLTSMRYLCKTISLLNELTFSRGVALG